MSVVGKLLGFPAPSRTYEGSPKLVLSKCLVGVEFECENVRFPLPPEEWAALWKAVKDNSLRGAGMEFVLREPLFGSDLINAVHHFCEWAKKHNFESNYRTGLHLHIDVRNLEAGQLLSMIIYYALYEKVIFNFVAPDREGSIFCLPFYKAEGHLDTISQMFRTSEMMKEYSAMVERYGALNLNSLSKYGSVEWRHFQCTFDENKVISWINLAQSFKKFGKLNPARPNEIVGNLSKHGPYELLEQIVGQDMAKAMWYPEAEKDVFYVGLPIAQDFAVQIEHPESQATWDDVRKALKLGTNRGFIKWAAKKPSPEFLRPDNPFLDPRILNDRNLQNEALRNLREQLYQALREVRFN